VGTKYKKSPIVEAVYEFAPTSPNWYEATPSQIANAIGHFYPKRSTVETVNAILEVNASKVSATAQPSVTRWRLATNEGDRMVQFGRDLCAFNALRPYSSYADYLPAMKQLVEEYGTHARPTDVFFLGQRYLNQVLLPDLNAHPADFFRAYPRLTSLHRPFSLQLQVGEVVQGGTVLSLIFQGLDAGKKPLYLLDLYVRSINNPDIPFQWDEMRVWQDAAHQAIATAFESAITDRCRELFVEKEG
jgi:uncharacterized protein (TIGR04255 family)